MIPKGEKKKIKKRRGIKDRQHKLRNELNSINGYLTLLKMINRDDQKSIILSIDGGIGRKYVKSYR